jgi:hypothetical protein
VEAEEPTAKVQGLYPLMTLLTSCILEEAKQHYDGDMALLGC